MKDMKGIEKTVNELDGMLPGLANSNRAGDYRLLMELGFAPAPAGTGRGAFHEWVRRVDRDGDVIYVNVVLVDGAAWAYVTSRSFKWNGRGEGTTVADALRNTLESAGFKKEEK